jgi:hypothetical protein
VASGPSFAGRVLRNNSGFLLAFIVPYAAIAAHTPRSWSIEPSKFVLSSHLCLFSFSVVSQFQAFSLLQSSTTRRETRSTRLSPVLRIFRSCSALHYALRWIIFKAVSRGSQSRRASLMGMRSILRHRASFWMQHMPLVHVSHVRGQSFPLLIH